MIHFLVAFIVGISADCGQGYFLFSDLFISWPIRWGHFMQPSMANLNSPSSRIVKYSTPSRRRILRYINFEIGESSPILFLDMMNLHLIIFKAWVNLERTCVLLFYYFLCFKVNLDLETTNQLGESSPNFVFAKVNLDPIILEKRWIDGESWPNDFVEKVNRGEYLRWVGSRCPLTRALVLVGWIFGPSSQNHFIVTELTCSRIYGQNSYPPSSPFNLFEMIYILLEQLS